MPLLSAVLMLYKLSPKGIKFAHSPRPVAIFIIPQVDSRLSDLPLPDQWWSIAECPIGPGCSTCDPDQRERESNRQQLDSLSLKVFNRLSFMPPYLYVPVAPTVDFAFSSSSSLVILDIQFEWLYMEDWTVRDKKLTFLKDDRYDFSEKKNILEES